MDHDDVWKGNYQFDQSLVLRQHWVLMEWYRENKAERQWLVYISFSRSCYEGFIDLWFSHRLWIKWWDIFERDQSNCTQQEVLKRRICCAEVVFFSPKRMWPCHKGKRERFCSKLIKMMSLHESNSDYKKYIKQIDSAAVESKRKSGFGGDS